MDGILKIIIFSSTAIIYLFIISKLLGKKQIAQLDFIDYVLGISIGSIAAEMATDLTEIPFWYYLIAMSIFFLFNIGILFLERKGPFFKRFFKGKPNMIIYDGKINFKDLKKSKLDINDLLAMSREKGYFDLNDIAYAVFENSGQLSILPKGNKKQVTVEDMKLPATQSSLPHYLIDDGHISFSSLNDLGKDRDWLFKKIKIKNKKELKEIILASYDEEKDQIIVTRKNG